MADTTLVYDWTPLIKISDSSYPYYFPQVRAENPNTSFPNPIRADILLPFDYAPVYDSEQPSYDVNTQYLLEGVPVKNTTDEKWYKTWVITQYTAEELAERLKNAKDILKSDALNVNIADFANPINYTYSGNSYQISLDPNQFKLLTIMKNIIDSSDGTQTFQFSFYDGTIVDINKTDFDSLFNEVMSVIYESNKAYWAFRATIDPVTDVTQLPTLPSTFRAE